ncbi:MAG: hypothetical protein RLZ10_414 [Bacteroidota bacterium]|jgi:hypothetical protein
MTELRFLNIRQCEILKAYGVKDIQTGFYWLFDNEKKEYMLASEYKTIEGTMYLKDEGIDVKLGENEYPAWTAEDILSILPKEKRFFGLTYSLFIEKTDHLVSDKAFTVYYMQSNFTNTKTVSHRGRVLIKQSGVSLVEALANMLIEIIENYKFKF